MQENKTAVGTVAATDPDGDLFTFAIAGGDDAEFFAINPNTGALRFLHSPDFETREDANADNVYKVVVSATDAHGEATTQAISVGVTNVSEPGKTFNGGNGSQTFVGTTGNDTMNGGNGNDNLDGNDGNDNINGGNDNDTLVGGRGNDKMKGENGNDSLDGGLGDDDLEGGNGRDTLLGGAGNDDLEGNNDDDVMDGGAGNDDLEGGSGNDLLKGGDGNDELEGDNGRDILVGGDGNDKLRGGDGDDLFVFGEGFGKDVVTDFDRHDDRIAIDDGLFQNFQAATGGQPAGRQQRGHHGRCRQHDHAAAHAPAAACIRATSCSCPSERVSAPRTAARRERQGDGGVSHCRPFAVRPIATVTRPDRPHRTPRCGRRLPPGRCRAVRSRRRNRRRHRGPGSPCRAGRRPAPWC